MDSSTSGCGKNRTEKSAASQQPKEEKRSTAFEHVAVFVRQAGSDDNATRAAALDQLYRETASYAYQIAAQWAQDPHTIDELVTDAYKVVGLHVGQLRAPRTFLRWLERIVNSLGRARAAKRYQLVSLKDLLVELKAGEEDLSRRTGDPTAVPGEGTEAAGLRRENDAQVQTETLGLRNGSRGVGRPG